MYHLTSRRKRNIRGTKPTVRTLKILGALKKEERRDVRVTEKGREPDLGGEDIPMIGEVRSGDGGQ